MNQFFEGLIPLFGMVFFFVAVVVIYMVKAQTDRAKVAARADVQSRMLDRFASSQEFVAFLQSREGQQFLSGATPPPITYASTRGMAAMRFGAVFGILGLGMALLAAIWAEYWIIPGILLLSLGAGLFASGLLSNRLARNAAAESMGVPQPPPASGPATDLVRTT